MRFTRMGFGLTNLERREFDYERSASRGLASGRLPVRGSSRLEFPGASDDIPRVGGPIPVLRFFGCDGGSLRGAGWTGPGSAFRAGGAPAGDPGSELAEPTSSGRLHPMGWERSSVRRPTRTPEGRPTMFVSGIPPEFSASDATPEGPQVDPSECLRREHAAKTMPLSIRGIRGIPQVGTGGRNRPGIDFPAGIELDSPLKTLALAWSFRDANLLFASEVNQTSRFVFRREVLERVGRISGATSPVPRGTRIRSFYEGRDRLDPGGVHGDALVPSVHPARSGGGKARTVRPEQCKDHRRRSHRPGDFLHCRRRGSAVTGVRPGLSYAVSALE